MTNLLAIIVPGDEFDDPVLDFINSLPDESIKFDSLGCTGNLHRNLYEGFKTKDRKHFLVLSSPTFEDLDTDYFKSTLNSALIEIPDGLKVKIHCRIQDYKLFDFITIHGACHQMEWVSNSVDKMIEMYNRFSSTDPEALVIDALKDDNFRKFAYTSLLGIRTKTSYPIFVSVGIETPDGQYLLGATYKSGPFTVHSKELK